MTGVDWAGHARRLRDHAESDAAARTAATGQPHRPDQNVLRVASSCDTAAYSPDRPNPRLERLVDDTLAATPTARPHTGNFDLSASPGHRPDTLRR